ncbi:TraR/DksA C4-type zinc finger protein [Tepidicaulis sp. LMO-SS28]|uniref:TraR/DksA C4-type zinc finger protein n=1 Tax=Tepidicaulis sp. LMO-SS28 TaxID=3447455 RepID=UPI003EE3E361
MDEVDWCQQLEDEERCFLIRRHLRASRSSAPAGDECADCGDPIPPERRQAQPGARLCISCQSEREKHR